MISNTGMLAAEVERAEIAQVAKNIHMGETFSTWTRGTGTPWWRAECLKVEVASASRRQLRRLEPPKQVKRALTSTRRRLTVAPI